MAEEFGTRVVTTHIGVIPSDERNPRYSVMLEALTECGKYACAKGMTLAIETGPEKADTLRKFLERTEGGVGVNLDPANFTMVTGQDAVEAVGILKNYIVHTHLKDGRRLDPELNPETVYHAFAVGGVEELNACKGFEELPIGRGDVDWDGYIKALKEIGYDGYLTIEREAGDNPCADIEVRNQNCRDRERQNVRDGHGVQNAAEGERLGKQHSSPEAPLLGELSAKQTERLDEG